jgi:glycosyltransferase involved in cell wall biosynthesis
MYGWNESGGGTALPKAVITEFAKRGYDVAVFYATAKHPNEKTPYFMEKTIDNGVKLYGIYNRPTIFLDADNPLREICDDKIIALFNSVIDEFQPNVINFHNFLGLSFEMATVAKSRNIVTTFTTHNYHLIDPKLYIYNNDLVSWKNTNFFENSDLPIRYPMLKDAYKARIDKAKSLLLNEIDYIFAVSNRVKELLSDFCGSDERICVINQIHNSLKSLTDKPVQNHIVGEKIRIAFIGDSIPHKGAHLIPQAAQFLTHSNNIHFDIWGDFDNEYGRAIKAIDKANIISLRGKYSANDLRKIAEQSDIALITSLCEETGPIVLSECLAMNLPVIASRIGGAEDFIVDGYNGSLFKAGSPKALAAVIQALVENPFKIEKMRNCCKIPYSFDEYISHLEGIYEI